MKRLLLLLVVVSAGCEAPGVYSTADRRQNTQLSRLEGSVVVNSKARGNVVVLLFDAARPPPPQGSGRPLTFTVLSKESVFGTAPDGDTGPFTAPFAFSLVAPGDYLVRGFVDANQDFIPWYSVTSDVNTGDVGGAAIEPSTGAFRQVAVTLAAPALDVPVSFADSARVPFDRPAFSVNGMTSFSYQATTVAALPLSPVPISQGAINESKPVFLAKFIDDDGDGMPDDANKDGVPDLWPKVLVRKLDNGPNPLLDENDLDKNGVVDATTTGADYDHQSGAADGKPDAVVLAAGIDPTPLAPLLLDAMGQVKTTPTPVTSLTLVLKPLAFDISNPAAPQQLKTVPPGRYAITLVQFTGQTWRVPNELSPGIAEALGLPATPSQSFVITVP